jgi:hypothetical protein
MEQRVRLKQGLLASAAIRGDPRRSAAIRWR